MGEPKAECRAMLAEPRTTFLQVAGCATTRPCSRKPPLARTPAPRRFFVRGAGGRVAAAFSLQDSVTSVTLFSPRAARMNESRAGPLYPIRCSPLIQRTVPLLARMTTLSVVILPPRRRFTPSSSEPDVTPVAAKMQSPRARSSSL